MFHRENDTGEKITVCQKMFLSTLGLTTDKTIETVLSNLEIHEQSAMYLIKEANEFLEIKYQIF